MKGRALFWTSVLALALIAAPFVVLLAHALADSAGISLPIEKWSFIEFAILSELLGMAMGVVVVAIAFISKPVAASNG